MSEFRLKRFKATLVNPDPDTLAALATRMKSTRGRAIDKLFVSLGLPLDCSVGKLEIHADSKSTSVTPPLLAVKELSTHYNPTDLEIPEAGITPASSETISCQRELSVKAKCIDVHTEGISEAVTHTVKLLSPEFMALMPGQETPSQSDTLPKDLSTKLDIHAEDIDLTLGRQVVHDGEKLALTG